MAGGPGDITSTGSVVHGPRARLPLEGALERHSPATTGIATPNRIYRASAYADREYGHSQVSV